MPRLATRRGFLAGSLAAPWLIRGAASANGVDEQPPTLDLHVHLLGIGDNGTGCKLSPAIQKGPLFRALEESLEVRLRAATLDEGFELALAQQLTQSGLTKAVVLAQDGVYDRHGKLDMDRTHFYVPNDHVLAVTAKYPEQMVACVSINPARQDAGDELDRCVAQGARVLKIHPPIQGVDPGDERYKPFFRRCAAAKVLVMVHTGHEHSAPVVSIEYARPARLRLALDEGCTVVACHSGSGRPADQPDMLPEFLQLLRDYEKQGNLWGDTAVLGGLFRARDFARLLEDDLAKSRLLHGSDFPFPAMPVGFADAIGARRAAALQMESNLLRRDFGLKEAMGIGRASAERAYRLICR